MSKISKCTGCGYDCGTNCQDACHGTCINVGCQTDAEWSVRVVVEVYNFQNQF
jgi:hypothetical protein